MIKLRKKYKELNLLVKRKQSIKLSNTIYAHLYNSKKVTTIGQKTPKNHF